MDKYCCPYCQSDDIELVPVADGVKFDVRPQLKDGTFKIFAGSREIKTMEDMMQVCKENSVYPYGACHSCTAEFDFTGEEAYFEEE